MTNYESALNNFLENFVSIELDTFIDHICANDVFKLGQFVLKSNYLSPIYIDFRGLISSPSLMNETAYLVQKIIKQSELSYDYVLGVPFGALALGSRVSFFTNKPMIMNRSATKNYGTKKLIEGVYEPGKRVLVIEDVVTTGASVIETVELLRNNGLVIENVVSVLDRQQGASENLKKAGIQLCSVLNVSQVLESLIKHGKINVEKGERIFEELKNPKKASSLSVDNLTSWSLKTRREKLELNLLNKKLLGIMERKKTNLCAALDLPDATSILQMIQLIKNYVCAVKLHADSLSDVNKDFFRNLRRLADDPESGFLIFEDRKFADTGNTNCLQAIGGGTPVASWSDVVTVHSTPGTLALQSFSNIVKDENYQLGGVLLVAELSTENNLTQSCADYIPKTVEMGKKLPDIVSGFICQKRCSDNGGFLYWTPGVHLTESADGKGQQWRTVEKAIIEDGNDIIIVGRGITDAKDVAATAAHYQEAAWKALKSRA